MLVVSYSRGAAPRQKMAAREQPGEGGCVSRGVATGLLPEGSPAIAPVALMAVALITDPVADTDAVANLFDRSSIARFFWEDVCEPVRRAGDAGAAGGCDRRRYAGSLWPLETLVEADAALLWRLTGDPGVADDGPVSFP